MGLNFNIIAQKKCNALALHLLGELTLSFFHQMCN